MWASFEETCIWIRSSTVLMSMKTYNQQALGILLNTKISAKERQKRLSRLAKEAKNLQEGRVECPECGHNGPHDSNGLPHQHDEHTLCCSGCGMQFLPERGLIMDIIELMSVPKFLGYCPVGTLPIKRGMTITILKGAMVKTIGKEPKPAGRTYKVKVNHILPGSNEYCTYHGEVSPQQNPKVCWAGANGYWCEVDINDVPEAFTAGQ
jgi:hypothetical protein